jgi:PcRGLX-like N-terminal RIFT barrel domain
VNNPRYTRTFLSPAVVAGAVFLVLLLAAPLCLADELPVKLIANMEGKTNYVARGRKTQPKVALTDAQASEGKMSLRVEHTGTLPARMTLEFPVDGAAGYDTLAFDLYTEESGGHALLRPRLKQKPDAQKKSGLSYGQVVLGLKGEGWQTVYLTIGKNLKFHSVGGGKQDWAKLRSIQFSLHGGKGKTVFYLDNIRLTKGAPAKPLLPKKTPKPVKPTAAQPNLTNGLVANMEGKTNYVARGRKTQPKVTLTDARASEGKKSLRVEHTGTLPARMTLEFPVDSAVGYDTLAFDLYTEEHGSHTQLRVSVTQIHEARKKLGLSHGRVVLGLAGEGWHTVYLTLGKGLKFLSLGGGKLDWSKLRSIQFSLHGGKGKAVFYLDNIRFMKGAPATTPPQKKTPKPGKPAAKVPDLTKEFIAAFKKRKVAPVGDVRIPIHIDDPTGFAASWPLTCGVPFNQGTLKSAQGLSVEDAQGASVPCQIDTTATWLDGSVRWVLASFTGQPGKRYFLRTKGKPASVKGVTVARRGTNTVIDTGVASFQIGDLDALIAEANVGGRVILRGAGRGAYVVDNQGRKARLGGAGSEMTSRFEVQGPMWTVLRREGWYVTDDGVRIARGIVWMHFYGGSQNVKLVHRLVLTEDTNKVWFKDIGIDFPTAFAGPAKAVFDTSKAMDDKATTVALAAGDTAWMLQDDYPHFSSTSSHFSLTRKTAGVEKQVLAGKACGDWAHLSGAKAGLTVVLRKFAEQFPKEFTVMPSGVTVHLWAGRSGRELDFRTKTLTKEYWGEWSETPVGGAELLSKIHSNAQSSAKTHTLWLLPTAGRAEPRAIAPSANAAATRVLCYADPKWTCATYALGPRMAPRDAARYPAQEKFIDDTYARQEVLRRVFPLTGYIGWGSAPGFRLYRDKKTNNWRTMWWRLGKIKYELQRHVWTLYARSGDRKYFDHGERYNQFSGDMIMHHWNVGIPGDIRSGYSKFKGGFPAGVMPKVKQRLPYDFIGMPLYWGRVSYRLDETYNYLCQFYMTGDWHAWELAENHHEAARKYSFVIPSKPARGSAVPLRFLSALYSMHWDPQIGSKTVALAHKILDLKSPNAINEKTPPTPLYKTHRNIIPIYEYYRFTGDEYARKCLIKMIEYDYRFDRLREGRPVSYRNPSALAGAVLYDLTGDKKYLALCQQVLTSGLRQWKDELDGDVPLPADPKKELTGMPPLAAAHFNYHTCLGLPLALHALGEYKGAPLPAFPTVKKYGDSTSNAWVVLEKQPGKPLDLELGMRLLQSDKIDLVVIGPDMKRVRRVEILDKRLGMVIPFVPSVTPAFISVRIPADMPGGIYRVGHSNLGPFTVLSTTSERASLECPDGLWVGNGDRFLFRVPPGQADVKVFVSNPVRITRADGSVALSETSGLAGVQTLPVNGKSGFWAVENGKQAYVRLINVAPVFAYITPDRFVAPKKLMASQRPKPARPDPLAAFVDGAIGQGLQLRPGDTFRFKRGEKQAGGGYKNFPGDKGTIEFWFRPNWSALDLAFPRPTYVTKPMLSAGCINMAYRYGMKYSTYRATLDFNCGIDRHKSAKGRIQIYGSHARIYPEAGQWIHIAATWDKNKSLFPVTKANYRREEHFFVFVNGKRYFRKTANPGRLRHYLGKSFVDRYNLAAIAEWVQLNPADATFDELRISDSIRYTNDFTPTRQPFERDKHTKALFHFDGSADGIGGDGKPVVVEYKDKALRR